MGAWLGLDLGEKRVGVAICEESLSVATGLETLEFQGRKHLAESLKKLITEYQSKKVVVGHPLTLQGKSGIAAGKIEEIFRWLQSQIPEVEWVLWDERLTTKEVERVLLQADLSRDKRKQVRDQLAAQRILQNYVDAHRCHSRESGNPLDPPVKPGDDK